MKKITTFILSLASLFLYAQTPKTLEGYYNLSEFEMPARLYLLDDGQFYYSAIFGSVDLEIYGTYTINDNYLDFHPREEQMQPFVLYAREDETLKDSIRINYYKPDEDYRYQVVFAVGREWVKNTSATNSNDIRITIQKKKMDTLKIGYPVLQEESSNLLKVLNTYLGVVPKDNNDLLLSYNRYYYMRKQFSKNTMQLDGEAIRNSKKMREREPLEEGEKEKILAFLKKHEMFERVTVSNAHFFNRILLNSSTSKTWLQLKENGQLEEIPITSIPQGGNEENPSYDSEKMKEVGNYNEKGEKIGEWKIYYENGALALIENYKKGKLDGAQKGFYETGELKGIVTYTNGEFLEWKEFYKNGQLEKLAKVVLEKKQKWKYYFIDGTLKEEVTRNEEGDRDGEYKVYYKNGKLSRLAIFKEGKLIGEWKDYDEKGKLVVPKKHN